MLESLGKTFAWASRKVRFIVATKRYCFGPTKSKIICNMSAFFSINESKVRIYDVDGDGDCDDCRWCWSAVAIVVADDFVIDEILYLHSISISDFWAIQKNLNRTGASWDIRVPASMTAVRNNWCRFRNRCGAFFGTGKLKSNQCEKNFLNYCLLTVISNISLLICCTYVAWVFIFRCVAPPIHDIWYEFTEETVMVRKDKSWMCIMMIKIRLSWIHFTI